MQMSHNVYSTERIASIVGGLAFVSLGLSRRSTAGNVAALIGSGLLLRGATGYCPIKAAALGDEAEGVAVMDHDEGFTVDHSVTVQKPASELYEFWRRFENLPQIMNHLESVSQIDDKRSHWVAEAPAGRTVEWDASIIQDVPNEMISWKSDDDAEVPNAGSVHFTPAPGGRGTEVRVRLRYDPPFGKVGRWTAKLFREEPSVQVADDLRRFKQMMESGEVATIDGQPSGRKEEWS